MEVDVKKIGLVISPKFTELAASPDGIVYTMGE